MKQPLSLLLALFIAWPAPAQPPAAKPAPLTVDWIMQGPALFGYAPRAVRWSGDGQRVYFEWKQASDATDKDYETWVVQRDGSGLRKLTKEQAKLAPPQDGSDSSDHQLLAYSENGDLFVYDRRTDQRRQLTKTGDAETSPRFTRDNKRITFLRAGNLYAISLDNGYLEQLTDIRAGGAETPAAAPPAGGRGGQGLGFGGGGSTGATGGTERKGTDSQESLKKEERSLLEVVDQRAKKRAEREAERKAENPRKTWNLAPRQSVMGLLLSPDETYVLATVAEPASDAKNTIVPNYVTESAYTENLNSRGNVGDSQGRTRVAILQVASGEYKWLDHGQKEKQGEREVERTLSLQRAEWSEDGKKLVMLGRSADFKDRWVFAIDASAAKARPLFHLHDDAWVGGPGGFTLGWLAGDKSVYFQAELDGWSQLYAVDYDGGEPRALTSGKWEVESAVLSKDRRTFFLTTSEESLHERHLYSMPAEGGPRTKLTSEPGDYEGTWSPDEKSIAVIHGYTNRPPELYLMDSAGGSRLRRITKSPSPEFQARAWLDVPIVKVPARDGAQVPGRLFKPAGWKKGGPAVMFVHGAGYLQNVHRGWAAYPREYLFHQLLMEHGFLVLDIDYRASAGYGRDWRTAIYRYMGGKDLDDHIDAAQWLVKEHGVDARRIGIYGGSYGGFITLMAMFTQPGVFAAGAALRPVTDWAHYNHGYTGSILNLPQKDQEAYRRSSPIYHAAGLQGALLICHGVVDVNVHFQDTVRLAQKLIELRKENWEVAMYPVEDHGFVQPTSWADEYKRILKLFETNLKK